MAIDRTPEKALKLLRDRVDHWELCNLGGYSALPDQWHVPLQFRSSSMFQSLLRDCRDWIASDPSSWRHRSSGAEIFCAMAEAFDAPVIEVLDEGLMSGSWEQAQAVCTILRHAPRELVWDDVAFVCRALNLGADRGNDVTEAIGAALHVAVMSGFRSGTPGEPFPEDVYQRDKALEIADTLPRGSIEDRFYRSVAKAAETRIRWSVESDAHLMDGRDW